MKNLVVCGDSFAYGIGCVNLNTEPFGVLTAEHFGWDLIRLARGSASNYTIYLQGLFAADMQPAPHLVILSETSYDRVEWFVDDVENDFAEHTLFDLNYHQYPPHYGKQPHHTVDLPFYTEDSPHYSPQILSEQVSGIDDCLRMRKVNPNFHYYARLATESTEKLKLICDHYVKVMSPKIKENYDMGMLLQAYTYLKRKGIQCIILTNNIEKYKRFIDPVDLMFQNWYELSNKYPDTIKSMHTGAEGHVDTALRLIEKIKDTNRV